MNGTAPPQNNRVSAQRLLAETRSLSNSVKFNFPSYLRILGVFSERFLGKLWWKSAQYRPGPAGQFPLVSASVAIV
jgi:hypothetical protein